MSKSIRSRILSQASNEQPLVAQSVMIQTYSRSSKLSEQKFRSFHYTPQFFLEGVGREIKHFFPSTFLTFVAICLKLNDELMCFTASPNLIAK